MCGSAYDLQLSDAMNDLQEQVKVEHAPTDKNEHGVEVSDLASAGENSPLQKWPLFKFVLIQIQVPYHALLFPFLE